jgi:P27 family predicted phage terminase small subunit
MIGRPPKPTAIRAAEGNPGKRKLNRAELRQLVEAPKMPRDLSAEAKREWRRLAKLFLERGIIRPEDQDQLANLCEAIATLKEARATLADMPVKQRLMLKAGQGFQTNPLLYIIRDQVRMINRIGAEFGLSPAARTRLTYDEQASDAEDLEALLGGAVSLPSDHAIIQ